MKQTKAKHPNLIEQSKVFLCLIVGFFMLFSAPIYLSAKPVSAPDFSLNDLNGEKFALSDSLKAKQKLLIFFWASWCPHCQTALKQLSKKSGNFKLITINVGESKSAIDRFMRKYSYNFVVLRDDDGKVSTSYGVLGIPTFVLVEPDSSISYKDYTFPPDLE